MSLSSLRNSHWIWGLERDVSEDMTVAKGIEENKVYLCTIAFVSLLLVVMVVVLML